jgi:hypothetical protein
MLVALKEHRSSIVIQCLAVAALSAMITFATEPFRSWLNLIWMIGIPIAIAVGFNKTKPSRVLTSIVLVIVSLASAVSTAAYFGFGP